MENDSSSARSCLTGARISKMYSYLESLVNFFPWPPPSKGMNCMQNFTKITTALLGMYPPEHEVHHWLVVQVKVWDNLADAIYQVG